MKYIVTINNKRYEVEVEKGEASVLSVSEVLAEDYKAAAPAAHAASKPVQASPKVNASEGGLKCPMPGTVLDIRVSQGDRVKKGDILFILEAMKMENEVTAENDGVAVQILASKGQAVNTGDVLAIIQ